jgi:hypothetical protein
MVAALERIADALENRNPSAIQALPPGALSEEDAARFLGVDLPTVKYLISRRRLAVVKYGDQRVRAVLLKDLRTLLKERRQPTGDETARRRTHS